MTNHNTKFFGRIYAGDLEKLQAIPKNAILIYLLIKLKAGAKEEFYISQMQLAKELNISFSSVQKSLYRLKADGLLVIQQRGKQRANLYSFYKGDTHATVSISPPSDTHATVSISPPSDTHATVSIHRLEEKEKDNNNKLIKLIDKISGLWNWNIDASQYEEICNQYPNINHDTELLIIDGWLRKKSRIWTADYALKGIALWFSKVKETRKIPPFYRSSIHPSLVIKEQPRITEEEQAKREQLIARIEEKERKEKEEQQEREKLMQAAKEEEQKNKKEPDFIRVSNPIHKAEIEGASEELREIISLLKIEEGNIFTSYRLKNRKYQHLSLNDIDSLYILKREHFEGFYALASLFGLSKEAV